MGIGTDEGNVRPSSVYFPHWALGSYDVRGPTVSKEEEGGSVRTASCWVVAEAKGSDEIEARPNDGVMTAGDVALLFPLARLYLLELPYPCRGHQEELKVIVEGGEVEDPFLSLHIKHGRDYYWM